MHTKSFALLLACALILSACGSKPAADYSTPQKALAAFIAAANSKDASAYADCFVKAEQEGMLKTNLDSPYDEVRAGRVIEEGGFTVGFEEYYMDGKKVGKQPIAFVKEDSNWKASWAKSTEYREKFPERYK